MGIKASIKTVVFFCVLLLLLGKAVTAEQHVELSGNGWQEFTLEQKASAYQDPGMPESQISEFPRDSVQEGIIMNFRDASLDTILEYLSEVAGFAVVRETPVEGRITLMSRQPLSVEEALALLNGALHGRGYAAIPMGRILKVVPLSDAKKMSIPVRSGSNPDAIELTDRMITQIIPLRYVNASQLRQDLAPLLPAYAELAANVSSNSLILTDTEANIRRIVEIIRALDTAVSTVSEIRVFPLTYANASSTANLINAMFKDEQAAQQRTATDPRARFFARGQEQEAASGDESIRGGKVNATADDRTNTLVVSGPSDILDVIAAVIEDLDSSPAEEQAVMIYNLKNSQAANLESVLNNLFRSTTAATGAAASTQQRFQRTATPQSTTVATNASQVASSLAGQAYVVADPDSNSLMVMTASKNFERIKEIIDSLDRTVPQVLIKVLIAEVTHDSLLDLGAEFSLFNLTADGRQLFTNLGVASQTGGIGFRLLEQDISVAVSALQKVGKLDILSRPYILGSDNQPAEITVGQRVPFITASRLTETGQTINTIQYQDIGIILQVTPHINPDGLVILDVTPEISALTGTTVPISETVNAPVYAKRSATSRVSIQDGQTIVIGGLMEDRKTDSVHKVPLLGDIPLLGRLFSRTITDSSKTELLIFLTPHVAARPDILSEISMGEIEGSRIIPNAIEDGAFEKYMEGMKRRAPLE